jgi:hypothetical protein
MRSLAAQTYRIVALGTLAALGAEVYFGLALGFAPGWANGWPGGHSIYRVWSAGMTVILFMIQMTVGVGLGALIGLLLSRSSAGRRFAGLVFSFWLLTCTALTVLTCSWAYCGIYDSTLAMWPNGYPGGP